MKINPYLGIVIAITFGAFNGVLAKWLQIDSTVITFFRLSVPAVILFLFIKFYKKAKIIRPGYKGMLAASALNAARMFLYFSAFVYTSIANAVIILYTWPIFSSIFGILFIKEKARLKEWLLIILAFVGVVVMLGSQELSFSNKDLVGMIMMLLSAAMYAGTVVIFKKGSDEYSPVETIFYQSILGAVIFFPFIFIKSDGLTITKSLVAMGHYGLLVGIGSFILIFTALKKLKVIQFSLIHYWEVIASVTFGIIFFGEKITTNMIFGGLMIVIAGAGLIVFKQEKAKHIKLLLSSSGKSIYKLLPKIVDKPVDQLKIGWVITASKGVDDLTYLEVHKAKMQELGWNFEEIDIEGKTQKELRDIFADKDIVYVEGGNTFYLLKAVRETGFDKIIKELIDRGILYVGSSAGSYIVCPTIEMAAWKTDFKPRYGLEDLTGLNYVPFLLSAHYNPKNDEVLRKAIGNTKYTVKILTDEQAIYVDNDKVELVGEGEEIQLS